MASDRSPETGKRGHEDESPLVVPKPLKLDDDEAAVVIRFHPNEGILGVGTVLGNVIFYSVGDDGAVRELMGLPLHKKSARCVDFSSDGQLFATASKDRSFTINDFSTGKLVMRTPNAHKHPIFCLHVLSEHTLATGDENGCVKVWDKRHPGGPVCEFSENDDLITDIISDSEKKRYLINSSSDGTVTAHDLRKKSLIVQSEMFDAELLCMAKMKSETKVICGSGDGTVQIFNWGEWGNISDRMVTHNDSSIDCLLPVTDQVVLAGSFDGKIRALSVFPNQVIETVGTHGDFPIESMSTSPDGGLLASSSHDDVIKFYNVEKYRSMVVDMPTKKTKKGSKAAPKADGFFADL